MSDTDWRAADAWATPSGRSAGLRPFAVDGLSCKPADSAVAVPEASWENGFVSGRGPVTEGASGWWRDTGRSHGERVAATGRAQAMDETGGRGNPSGRVGVDVPAAGLDDGADGEGRTEGEAERAARLLSPPAWREMDAGRGSSGEL